MSSRRLIVVPALGLGCWALAARIAFVLAMTSTAFGAVTQLDLDKALAKATAAWRSDPKASSIEFVALGTCKSGEQVAWTDLVTREIMVNSDCQWDRSYLELIVKHEVGHLLIGQGHSTNVRSVMYRAPLRLPWYLRLDSPRITRADRMLLIDRAKRERPAIFKTAFLEGK